MYIYLYHLIFLPIEISVCDCHKEWSRRTEGKYESFRHIEESSQKTGNSKLGFMLRKVYIYVFTCLHVHIDVYYTHIYPYLHMCIYICICVYVFNYIYIYTCIYACLNWVLCYERFLWTCLDIIDVCIEKLYTDMYTTIHIYTKFIDVCIEKLYTDMYTTIHIYTKYIYTHIFKTFHKKLLLVV
jgi:hypothetical protein